MADQAKSKSFQSRSLTQPGPTPPAEAPAPPNRHVGRIISLVVVGFMILALGVVRFGYSDVFREVERYSLILIPSTVWKLLLGTISLLAALWAIPKLQVSGTSGLTADNQFDRENEARKTLAQIVAGTVVILGIYSSVQTLDISREGQITDRFTKAVDQIGAVDNAGKPKVEVRIGGMYALERISHDSTKDEFVVMELLAVYVKQHLEKANKTFTPGPARDQAIKLPNDIAVALNILAERNPLHGIRPDLEGTQFAGRWMAAKFPTTDLSESDFSHCECIGATFSGSDLSVAVFKDATVSSSDFTDSIMIDANFERVKAVSVHFENAAAHGVRFDGADLTGSWFIKSQLSYASFNKTIIDDVNFEYADLSGADLRGALFKNSSDMQKEISQASGDKFTQLPSNLRRPESWH